MSTGPTGDYGYVIDQLISYLRGKGQIYSAAELASILAVAEILERRFGVAPRALKTIVENWVKLSEIEAARWTTVAQKNIDIITKLGMQINYVEEQASRTKYLPFGRKKKE